MGNAAAGVRVSAAAVFALNSCAPFINGLSDLQFYQQRLPVVVRNVESMFDSDNAPDEDAGESDSEDAGTPNVNFQAVLDALAILDMPFFGDRIYAGLTLSPEENTMTGLTNPNNPELTICLIDSARSFLNDDGEPITTMGGLLGDYANSMERLIRLTSENAVPDALALLGNCESLQETDPEAFNRCNIWGEDLDNSGEGEGEGGDEELPNDNPGGEEPAV